MDGRLLFGARDGSLELLTVKPPGGRAMDAAAYLRGHALPHARAAGPRSCAYEVLRRVFERGAYADEAMQVAAKTLDARDRALAMRLAYGAVQRTGTLDHLIGELSQRPAQSLDAPDSRRASTRVCMSSSTSTARPTTPSSPMPSSSPSSMDAPGTVSSTPYCAAPRARVRRRSSARSAIRRPRRPPSSTPTPSGSRACGGRSSAPRRRAG